MADTTTTTTTTPETAPVRGQQGQRDNNKRPRDDKRGGGFKDAPKEFQEELLWVDRVTRVTAGGRQLRFRASVVIGNGKGTVGFGIGKAGEVVIAIEKAIRDAKKNLISFAIIDGTIAYDLTASYKAANIFIHPASKGTGIISGGSARKIFAVSGIKDILAKQRGANNPITNARVTMKALSSLRKVTPRLIKTPVVAEEGIKEITPKAIEAKPVVKKEAPVVAKEVTKEVVAKAAPVKKTETVAKKAPAAKKPAAKPAATKAAAKKPAAKKPAAKKPAAKKPAAKKPAAKKPATKTVKK